MLLRNIDTMVLMLLVLNIRMGIWASSNVNTIQPSIHG
jgi:hypothetical protein